MRKKRDDSVYFIGRRDESECEFEANYVHMGWYPHTREELIECKLITTSMLSRTHLSNKIVDVPPGHREDCDDDVLYEEDIDYKFHQGNGITCAWNSTSILVDLVCRKTADKKIKLRNEDENKYSNIHLMRGHDSVSNLLTKHTDFQLKNVKDIGELNERADNIIKRDKGLFVCVLSDMNRSTNMYWH